MSKDNSTTDLEKELQALKVQDQKSNKLSPDVLSVLISASVALIAVIGVLIFL